MKGIKQGSALASLYFRKTTHCRVEIDWILDEA